MSDEWEVVGERAKEIENEKADREAERMRTREERSQLANGVYAAPTRTAAAHTIIEAPLVVVDHFDFGMIDLNETGARIMVRGISKHEALELVRKHQPPSCSMFERGQNDLEQELQLEPVPRPRLRPSTQLLVMQKKSWKDVRWFLVTYESDGDGVIE